MFVICRLFFLFVSFLSFSVFAVEKPELYSQQLGCQQVCNKAENSNEQNTIDIFKQYSPSVVYVHRLATYVDAANQIFEVAEGSGSGIVWSKEGYIITNYHVVRGADKLAISIENSTFTAKVIGVEPYKDIAVLKINPKNAENILTQIKPIILAPTNELLVGQKAIAIGNPFGLDHSLSVGVISALGRQVPGIGGITMHDMIQTDAAINPGNSGGPLLDSSGRLLGMNTAIFSHSGNSAGVSFAVSADDIGRIVPEIIKNGHVVMAGIGISRVPPYIAHKLNVHNGVLVKDVFPGSPADKAGLHGTHRGILGDIKLGDIIVGINGHPVVNYDVLYGYLSKIKVGTKIMLDIERNGTIFKVKLKTIDITAA